MTTKGGKLATSFSITSSFLNQKTQSESRFVRFVDILWRVLMPSWKGSILLFFSNPRNVGKSFASLSLRGSCKRGLHTPPPLPLVENLEFSGTWFVVRTPWWWTHKTGGPTFSTNRFVTILDTHLIGFQTSILLSDWQRMASGRATGKKKEKRQ